MNILHTSYQQISLFLLILTGMFLTKKRIITPEGKKCLINMVIDFILPCNIIKSYLLPFKGDLWETFSHIFLAGLTQILLMVFLNLFIFNKYTNAKKRVLQYASLVPNSAFLGYPVAEGIYGPLGLFYSSIFLIPLRIFMWAVGTSYFIPHQTNNRAMIWKVVSHPCLIAVYIGLFIMAVRPPLPGFFTMVVRYVGNCNAAITMFIIGTILVDVPLSSIFNRDCFLFCCYRLFIIPLLSWGIAYLFKLDVVATGIAVMMTSMPAGATTSILAAKYDSDAPFATQIIVLSTILSMFTVVLWCMILPHA